ncbi:FAM50 family protein [Lachnellula occidentalis]|uniref:FAM50 family protein n=1 Tax=Lachnellula occidentalis TaxID=215460 RepID=A0A8H8RW03_9HELO|nr:FAM50 family protein [Lachnellula occidentalis]
MASNPSSGGSTPNARFTSQKTTAEDLLSTQTVGLVKLSDFRKRRAEAVEQKDRDAQDLLTGTSSGTGSGRATPDGASTPMEPPVKKKKRKVGTPKLSFGMDEEEEGGENTDAAKPLSGSASRSGKPLSAKDSAAKKKGVNSNVSVAPRLLTKSALLKEAQTRESLRKEFLALQEAVKATEINIPFVFYDGTNIPGGVCTIKKGDYAWVFLDRSRKVGADLGVGEKVNSRREWARIGVDDLMMVRGNIIIPHHYDFYYFVINHTLGPGNRLLFDYNAEPPTKPTPPPSSEINLDTYNPLSVPSKTKPKDVPTDKKDLEGTDDDPTYTKVVDRRWYERNKHIFPASVWQEFDPEKDYQKEVKRDAGGNAFFFS